MPSNKHDFDPELHEFLLGAGTDRHSIQTAANTDELIKLTEQVINSQQKIIDSIESDRKSAKKSFIIQTCISVAGLIAAAVAAVAAVVALF